MSQQHKRKELTMKKPWKSMGSQCYGDFYIKDGKVINNTTIEDLLEEKETLQEEKETLQEEKETLQEEKETLGKENKRLEDLLTVKFQEEK